MFPELANDGTIEDKKDYFTDDARDLAETCKEEVSFP